MKAILFFLVLGWVFPFLNLKNSPVATVSFQVTRKLIVVQATVDGREGLFILDKGVSDVIPNNGNTSIKAKKENE